MKEYVLAMILFLYIGTISGIALAIAGLLLTIFHIISWSWTVVMIVVGIIIAVLWHLLVVRSQYKDQEENPTSYTHIGPW